MSFTPLQIIEIDHVVQKFVHPERGDCMKACIASLLRLPLETIPCTHENNSRKVINWLWERGLTWKSFTADECRQGLPAGYLILGVASEVYPGKAHAVVGFNSQVVWDPSPYASKRTLPYAPYLDAQQIVKHGYF